MDVLSFQLNGLYNKGIRISATRWMWIIHHVKRKIFRLRISINEKNKEEIYLTSQSIKRINELVRILFDRQSL
jgi:hypothetical protein